MMLFRSTAEIAIIVGIEYWTCAVSLTEIPRDGFPVCISVKFCFLYDNDYFYMFDGEPNEDH